MSSAADGLCIEQVHIWRGDRHVLKGVSCALSPGELLHVSGANGAGKTTLLRVACGLLRPERGLVAWRGQSISRAPDEYHEVLAFASHDPALKSDLTALENLHYSVGLKRRVTALELRDSLEQAGVGACADLPTRVLSAGQRRRVAMARVLAMRAAVWLLDEPFTNLDDAGSSLVCGFLDEHVACGGLAVIVAHHDLQVRTNHRRLILDA